MGMQMQQTNGGDSPHIRPRSVHRAVLFMERTGVEVVSLTDVIAAAGVKERTLHEAFRHFETTSPMRFLRGLRLDRARTQLVEGRTCVADAAVRSGFRHLSRFAHYYEQRFGEKPSTTLRRSSPDKLQQRH